MEVSKNNFGSANRAMNVSVRVNRALRSLTQHWGGKLIAVIVSGYDGDGADWQNEIRDPR